MARKPSILERASDDIHRSKLDNDGKVQKAFKKYKKNVGKGSATMTRDQFYKHNYPKVKGKTQVTNYRRGKR
jgi:hypothetical protein